MTPLYTRRTALSLAIAASFTRAGGALAQAVSPYSVGTKLDLNLPKTQLGSCAELEASLKALDAQIVSATGNVEASGDALLKHLTVYRKNLTNAIKAASDAQVQGLLDQAFATMNLAYSLFAIALGVSLVIAGASAFAIGLAAGASAIVGATLFGVQTYFKQGSADVEFVVGFSVDRAIMFTEMIGQAAGRKIMEHAAQGAALFVSSYNIFKANGDTKKATAELGKAIAAMKAMDTEITALGTDKKKWGEFQVAHLKAVRQKLAQYITMTKPAGCVIPTANVKP